MGPNQLQKQIGKRVERMGQNRLRNINGKTVKEMGQNVFQKNLKVNRDNGTGLIAKTKLEREQRKLDNRLQKYNLKGRRENRTESITKSYSNTSLEEE